jgi:MFS family permease
MTQNDEATEAARSSDALVTPSAADLRRARWAGFVGTFLENFDMVVYSTATALVFNHIFFPNVSPVVGYISSFGAYAVGFGARPLGGLFFSRFGDRLGRRFVMVATLYLMGSATFAMGLLPTYEQVGLLAPVLLVLCRFLQGFGAGAEMASGVVLLTEYAPEGRRGRTASMVWIGAAVGFVVAALVWMLVQALLPQDALLEYGWRFVFLSSILVTVAAYIIRRTMKESPVFREVKEQAQAQAHTPVRDVFRHGRKPLLGTALVNIGSNGHSYIYSAFLGAYLVGTVQIDASIVPLMLLIGGLAAIPGAWLAGAAIDRWGRRPVSIVIMATLILFAGPAFLLLNTGNTVLIAVCYVVGFVFAVEGAPAAQSPMFAELFGSRYRYAGVAIAREFSAILGGGIAPIICAWLLALFTGSFLPIVVYMVLIGAISLVTVIRLPETRDRDLLTTADAI